MLLAACGGGGGGGSESTQSGVFTVSITVSGLTGTVVLQNNGANNLSVSANGTFAFSGTTPFGQNYAVTVLTQPLVQNCTVANGTGTVSGAVNLAVTCATVPPAAPVLAVTFGYKQFQFTWAAVPGATSYRLSEDANGVSGFTVVANNLVVTSYNHAFVSLFGRLNAKYQLEACDSAGCTPSTALNIAANLSTALGAYAKASNTGANDNFGQAVALSSDGNTLAVSAIGEDGAGTSVVAGSPDNTATGDAASSAGAVYVFSRSGATWSQQAYIKASNAGAGDAFGFSMSLTSDGNTLAVGAPFEASATTAIVPGSPNEAATGNGASGAGAVYIFKRSGTTWTQQTYVKAFNAEANDFFGWSVALSPDGGTLAVGAIGEDGSATVDDNATSGSGAVYVYFLTFPSTWTLQGYLKASNAGVGDSFGFSVSLSSDSFVGGEGNLLAVGAPLEDSALTGVTTGTVSEATAGNVATDSGAVYTFKRASNAWTQHTYIKASNAEFIAAGGDRFGTVVALSADGRTLAVSAPREDSADVGVSASSPTPAGDNDSAADAGAVYVFNRLLSGTDSWAQQAYIKASNTGTQDAFGGCIALSADGNTLAIGAVGEDSGLTGITPGSPDEATTGTAMASAGAVYRFTRSGTVWTQQAYVKASNPAPTSGFGGTTLGGGVIALSSDGSTMAVGALGEASSATGINGNQADNSAAFAGAVYLY